MDWFLNQGRLETGIFKELKMRNITKRNELNIYLQPV
jgi:hypothetical protein